MSATCTVQVLAAPCLVLTLSTFALAQAPSRSLHPPDVPFQSAPREVVIAMLALAKVAPNDVVYDLGSGDGRILIAAAELHHARGVGIEIDPQLIKEANQNVGRERLQDRISLRNEDLFQADIHEANVVTLFLWPQVNLKLRPKLLRELRPGTRVVSYCWNMGDWVPEKTIRVGGDPIYLWTIPNDGTTR